jgi:hypothetical protein
VVKYASCGKKINCRAAIEYNQEDKRNAVGGAIITADKNDVICVNNERDGVIQPTGQTF